MMSVIKMQHIGMEFVGNDIKEELLLAIIPASSLE